MELAIYYTFNLRETDQRLLGRTGVKCFGEGTDLPMSLTHLHAGKLEKMRLISVQLCSNIVVVVKLEVVMAIWRLEFCFLKEWNSSNGYLVLSVIRWLMRRMRIHVECAERVSLERGKNSSF